MDLPNQYFEDYPIEFKEINPSDFPNFQVEDKIIISPNSEGFINDTLRENINIDEKNTLVINAAVGQGKTYAIIQIIKEYFEAEEDFLIFVAVPFTSLVQQYCLKIFEAGIPENQIYSYDYIGNEMHLDAWDSKIQVLTANALLGNPGEDAFVNSQLKRDYTNCLVSKAEMHNRKVIIIYDEIHDAIHNFKEEYIFNLWKWKNVLHKNILLSATYNEASKVVIEYLAELTEDKIKIIESERIRFPEKQSDLYLYFNPSKTFHTSTDELVNLVRKLISEEKNIDILSFSKILANDICTKTEEGVGALLFEAGIETQNCTSDLNQNQRTYREPPLNRYDPHKCNVGTNFKSGVSIEKENHAFIVIMPPLGRKGSFRNSFGIFTDGINSVIQALARQRTKGEIHILLSPPDKFNMNSLPFQEENKKEVFASIYQVWQNFRSSDAENDKVSYMSLNNQNEILNDYYENTLREEIRLEQAFVENLDRGNKVRLEYPDFRLFKLNKGEKYLASKIKFFGKDISSYITYAAITNQFINCKLAGVNIKPPLFFREGKVQYKLENYFMDYMDEDFYNSLFYSVSDSYKYFQVKNDLFENYKILYKNQNGSYDAIQPWTNQNFELQFIAFIQRKFKPRNRDFVKRYYNEGYFNDAVYSRGEYFMSCISHSLRLKEVGFETALTKAYLSLNYFRQKVLNAIENYNVGNNRFTYLKSSITDNFIVDEDLLRFREMKEVLITQDRFIVNGVFNFSNNFIRRENRENEFRQIKWFYKILKEDFFVTKHKRINSLELNENVFKILEIKDIPDSTKVLDFVSPVEPEPFDTLPEITSFNF